MIDKEKTLKAFYEYVSRYNPEDEKIMVKIEHIQRVAKNANDIAENLKLTREDIDLAWLIGLLHDI
jgi:HD domain